MKSPRQKNALRLSFAAAALAATFLLLSPARTRSQATSSTFNFTEPVPAVTVGTCEGTRLISLTGEVHFVVHFTTSASGNQHVHYSINYQNVTGTDQFGSNYTVHSNGNDTSNFNAATQTSESVVQYFRLIGQGQVPNQQVRNVMHITINNTGEPTAVFDHFYTDCK
ncbi:MAG TPA: hypothetical protein VM914_10840 [Pyrinomonadaceae bacterium]|nr:hypothetical protein [Pyrinomonadaceae bacterium]